MLRENKSGRTTEERVLKFIQRNDLVSAGEYLPIGVSGGPDSVCLINILTELRHKLGIKLHIAHLDHGLRGAESEEDARYVKELAARLNIPATIEKRPVREYQIEKRLSLEEAAREVRYSFFSQLARQLGATRVAVGHTGSDLIETMLMHLIRGSGTRGLAGLRPEARWLFEGNRLSIIRPLLCLSRSETTTYCQSYELAPRSDSSNLSLSPLRNRIRLELLPLLETYNPQIASALMRTGRIASDDIDLIDGETIRLTGEISEITGNKVVIERVKFIALPAALRRSLLRRLIEELIGDLRNIEMQHIEAIMTLLDKPAGKRINLPRGLIFTTEYEYCVLSKGEANLSPYPLLTDFFPVEIPGGTSIPGWRITANIMDPAAKTGDFRKGGLKEDRLTACFDFDKTGRELAVRSRRLGDRFQPLGMSEPKKLGEFMIDAKIPRLSRQNIPVVCSPGQIVWVVGWRIDERVKVTENTSRILFLRFEPI